MKAGKGDFFKIQNYIMQLNGERKLSNNAVVLYNFYQSLAGFHQIRPAYDYISRNCWLSPGQISRANGELVNLGLVKLYGASKKTTYKVSLKPGSQLPKRQLVAREYDQGDQRTPHEWKDEPEYNPDQMALLAAFKDKWHDKTGRFYHKADEYKVLEIHGDPRKAIKYVPTLWALDEKDEWTKKSDHTFSVFVTNYNNGKLEELYPSTADFYREETERQNAVKKKAS